MNRHTLYIIIAGVLWGAIALFVNPLSALGLSSMQIVALRVTFSAVILSSYTLIKDRTLFKIDPKDIIFFIGTGVFSIVLFNYFYFEAINIMGSVAIPALLLYTAPIFVMIMSAIFFRDKITLKKVLCLLITIAGLVFITGALTGGTPVSIYALLVGIGSGFCYALYSIFSKPLIKKYNPLTITTYTFLIAALVAIPISGIAQNTQIAFLPDSILLSFGLAVVCTISPFILYTSGLKKVSPSKASILATIEPFIAALFGFFVFKESMTIEKIAGMVLIFASIFLINIKTTSKRVD